MMPWSQRPAPHEVFTPGSPPLDEHNVYVERAGAEKSLAKYVQRKQIPVVWGEYGVGKTSLVMHFFRTESRAGKLVYIPSVSGLTLMDIFRSILEHLNYSVAITETTAETGETQGKFDFKVISAAAKGTATNSVTRELVVTSPTDNGIQRIIRDNALTVVLDEVHKASPELRAALTDWIKATRADPGDFTLVLVGTSTDAGRLVALDYGIDRYIKEMPVELMTPHEARKIVDEGFEKLGLSIEPEYAERLTQCAAGAPTIVQSLCLETAERAIEEKRSTIVEDDLRHAVTEYLREHGGRLEDHYFRAIETTGPRRYRKQILRAVANAQSEYVTMEEIRTSVSQELNEEIPSTSLSGPLRALKDREYGAILRDVDRDVSGTRIHNLTTFTDPMMKSFVRFMNNLDRTDLMPDAPTDTSHGRSDRFQEPEGS